MKHLLKKAAISKSDIIAHFKMGADTFSIINRDKMLRGIFDGYEILTADTCDKEKKRYGRTVSDFLGIYAKKAKTASVQVYKSHVDDKLAQEGIKILQPIVGKDNIVIKNLPNKLDGIRGTMCPDFHVEDTVDYGAFSVNLKVLERKINAICKVLLETKNNVLMLTRSKFVQTMWGAKDMQEVLSITKKAVLEESGLGRVDVLCEVMSKSLERLCAKLNTNLIEVCEEEKRYVSNVLIPNILGGYEELKSILIRTVMNLGALVYIDETFKEYTSYPADWFMDGSMIDNLNLDYEMILSFLTEIPKIEAKVIDPLDFVRMQLSR